MDLLTELQIKWFVNEVELVFSKRSHVITEGNTQILVILDVRLDDAGEYVCEVVNSNGKVDSRTTLIVTSKEIFYVFM